jgi:hypothetical protein
LVCKLDLDDLTTITSPTIISTSAGTISTGGFWPGHTQAIKIAPGISSKIAKLIVVADKLLKAKFIMV